MCVSDRPTNPNIFYAQKNNRSAKSGNSSLLSNFSKDVDSDSALKVRISGEWSHFSFHMERTVIVPSIKGLLNH
jgi:hypothetical protein